METKQTLRPGSPVNATALQKKPYIRPRDIVTVYARNGGITVKRTMRALQGGGLGDTIPVASLKGKDRFDVRITGYHETEVLDSATYKKLAFCHWGDAT